MKVKVARIPGNSDLPLPEYMSAGASGVDLYAAVEGEVTLGVGEVRLIPTAIRLAIPSGFEGQIRPRSGLALKNGISIVNSPGTIDSDYRGEVGIILVNHGSKPFIIRRKDRIAQLVISPVARAKLEMVDSLEETERNKRGFGYTGQ
ncbi:dUTP diphosphatase [candidate division NPL-UPA2 bacterium Unc8]|uniref:Deoxyuridine 5'-triphosphate nucleotidohydrolase n=1 Tax=candidate division NPL-UPA2 bacterium Unc8 TaxID=1980939 RepID=A0A399FZ51_UNCN2|nr:Deoxyuridine 5'-triphosphate nucleotidohydrolase [Bacillota bacterium]MBT9137819.1 Deoxyuridine 5'-triphosphate nucleotidohydrolase [Bacillota bacterium]MBT9146296.1 Deoxyuridine 5'-triphosphate nucleotidohydrolase [Bacillota bacterium]RII00709.1 MAG: dUTP diphosphatase [candidate division NPL-UPA2 bacterium Unc8]